MKLGYGNHLRDEDAALPFPSKPCDKKVRLADGQTTISITLKYWLTVSLFFAGREHAHSGWFYPVPQLSQSIILGYKTLTTKLYPLFMKVVSHHHQLWVQRHLAKGVAPCSDYLQECHCDCCSAAVMSSIPADLVSIALATDKDTMAVLSAQDFDDAEKARSAFDRIPLRPGDILPPFSFSRQVAPEEDEIPHPTSFHPDIWSDVPTPYPELRPTHHLLPQQADHVPALAAMYEYEQPVYVHHYPSPASKAEDFELAHIEFCASLADDYEERVAKYESLIDTQVHDDFPEVADRFRALLRTERVRQAFVPKDWRGFTNADGTPKVHTIEWVAEPPAKYIASIPVKPMHQVAAKKEFDHLLNVTFWEYSSSNTVSPMLVAPKATDPFIRLVSNYSWLRPYLAVPALPIPRVKDELARIKAGDPATGLPFTCFVNGDLLSAFHQALIDEPSRRLLAVSTPWGVVQPRLLPEGISPASAILMKSVQEMFRPIKDNSIIMFDNILLMGTSPEDLYEKFDNMIDLCLQHNVYLKLSKTDLNVKSMSFFGYHVDANGIELEQPRVDKVREIPFPSDVAKTPAKRRTLMQSYLGSANFFNGFMPPDYAERTAPLYKMTTKEFNWDPATWTVDYRQAFEDHKQMLAQHYRLYHPDHTLQWVLRTDASRIGCGGVLYQIRIVDGKEVREPLAFLTRKMSETAQRWSVLQLEAWAIYWCMTQLRALLRGKRFLLQTDHRNLQWLEKSTNVTVMRMVANLQCFDFDVEHIPGKVNIVADLLSRMYPDATEAELTVAAIDLLMDPDSVLSQHCVGACYGALDPTAVEPSLSLTDLLCHLDLDEAATEEASLTNIEEVHGGRHGHPGVARTWFLLNQRFPGHKYTHRQVQDFVAECITCQKVRMHTGTALPAVRRTLEANHARHVVAIDTAELPVSNSGNRYILLIHNMFTKYTHLVPMKNKDALSSAAALMTFFSIFGLCDVLHSDLGSDFTSTLHSSLVKWLGVGRSFAPVGRPEADGVEPTVREVKRHFQALHIDENIKQDWDLPANLGLVQLMLNELPHSQTGVSPLAATFGSLDAGYFELPRGLATASSDYVAALSHRLSELRARSHEYQQDLQRRRVSTASAPQTVYSPGDFVLIHVDSMDKDHQLSSRFKGPAMVLTHKPGSNLVSVRDLVTSAVTDHHVSRLRMFFGTPQQALETAQSEQEQCYIHDILEFKGNPLKRSTCTFYVQFVDGTCVWKRHDRDLSETMQFEKYCNNHRLRALRLLLYTQKNNDAHLRELRAMVIPVELPGSTFYLNLRYFHAAYPLLERQLPNIYAKNYYFRAQYGPAPVSAPRQVPNSRILVTFPEYTWGTEFSFVTDMAFYYYFGHITELLPDETLITPELEQELKLKW